MPACRRVARRSPAPRPGRGVLPDPGRCALHPQRRRPAHRPVPDRGRGAARRAAGSGLVVERADDAPSTGGRPPVRLRSTATPASCSPGRSGAAAPSSASATSTARCWLGRPGPGGRRRARGPDAAAGQAAPGAARRESGARRDAVRAVGLSIPGTVDFVRGGSLDSPIMSGWDGVELAPFLRRRSPTHPVLRRQRRQRDGAVRAARTARDAPRPAVREGVDRHRRRASSPGARCCAGRSARPARSGTPRPPSAEGLPCRCGDTGCVEAVAGGWALVQAARERGPRGRPHPRPRRLAVDGRRRRPAPGPRGRPADRRGAGLGGQPAQPRGRRRRRRHGRRPTTRSSPGCARRSTPGLRAGHPGAADRADPRRAVRRRRLCDVDSRSHPESGDDRCGVAVATLFYWLSAIFGQGSVPGVGRRWPWPGRDVAPASICTPLGESAARRSRSGVGPGQLRAPRACFGFDQWRRGDPSAV